MSSYRCSLNLENDTIKASVIEWSWLNHRVYKKEPVAIVTPYREADPKEDKLLELLMLEVFRDKVFVKRVSSAGFLIIFFFLT